MSSPTKTVPNQPQSKQPTSATPAPSGSDPTLFELTDDDANIVDRFLEKHIYSRIVPKLPYSLHPNYISCTNVCICWFSIYLAFAAVDIETKHHLLAFCYRLIVAMGVLTSLLLDSLDGLHARATKQTSKMGEILDHSFDCSNVLVVGATLIVSLGEAIPWYALPYTVLATGFIYNAQLVIFSRENQWILPPVSGVTAQLVVGLSQVVGAILFLCVHRQSPIVIWSCNIFVTVSIFIQFKDQWHYCQILRSYRKSHLDVHIRYVIINCVFALVFTLGFISRRTFILGAALISWKLNGKYLIRTVLRNDKTRKDIIPDNFLSPLVFGWMVLFFGLGLVGNSFLQNVAEWIFLVSLPVQCLYDLYTYYPEMRSYKK